MECLRFRSTQHTLFIAALLFALYPPLLFSQATTPAAATTSAPTQAATTALRTTPIGIILTPSMGAPGRTYELTIQPTDVKSCPNPLPKSITLVVPNGSPITLLSQQPLQANCLMIADISIAKDATPNSTVMLRLENDNHQIFGGPFPFNIAIPVTPPGPIPPGMKPTVDVMWGVVPDEIVHDEFGHAISKKFFCVEVVIGNDTGYPVQIVSVGFTMDGLNRPYEPLPSSGYETARAMLEVGQAKNTRGYFFGAINVLSTFSASTIPFIANHKAFAVNFNGVASVLSSPVTDGLKAVWPDLTFSQLNRLDNQILRDGLLIPNDTQERTVVFVPKDVVLAFVCEENIKESGHTSDANEPVDKYTECVKPAWYGCELHVTSRRVMESLGSLQLIGNEVAYINRVQVNSTPNTPSASLTPSSLDFTSPGSQKVMLSNTGTAPLNISKIDPAPRTNADTFSESNDCPTALAPGAACTITVTFTPPAAAGNHQATLSISDDAANSPQTVGLTAEWSPVTGTIGSFNGNSSQMTLTNNTGEPLTIKSIDLTGGQASDFALGDSACQTTLAAEKQCSTAVMFNGKGDAEQTTLDINDDKGNLIDSVKVTGPSK
ncbi:MAG TPA: choice-of-anchor D domain-containing protein [Terriglobia bacterium]|nr:choice-of-anchor D domain-containing protein [Terriglobia bacterium]